MKELNIQETIDDLKICIDKLKENLVYVVNEDLNDFIKYKVKYYQNIIKWLEELDKIKKKEIDDIKWGDLWEILVTFLDMRWSFHFLVGGIVGYIVKYITDKINKWCM